MGCSGSRVWFLWQHTPECSTIELVVESVAGLAGVEFVLTSPAAGEIVHVEPVLNGAVTSRSCFLQNRCQTNSLGLESPTAPFVLGIESVLRVHVPIASSS